MKKYDRNRTCKKCGYGGIEDVHRDAFDPGDGTPYSDLAKRFGCKYIPENIARTCKNCGYSWREKPVDIEGYHLDAKDLPPFMKAAMGITDDPDGINATCEMAKTDPPVIEVGDVVHDVREQKGTVIAKDTLTGMVGVHVENGVYTPFRCYPISALTLIHKGPKVHRFRGIQGMYIDIPKGAHTSALYFPLDHGKTYDLILTEKEDV